MSVVRNSRRRIFAAPIDLHGFQSFLRASRLHLTRAVTSLTTTIKRRFKRARRRRKVGRAYDMALEVASVLPRRADILDVGCGNGFIAHHLQSMLGKTVVGLDVGTNTAAAQINYLPYDGRHFPVRDDS